MSTQGRRSARRAVPAAAQTSGAAATGLWPPLGGRTHLLALLALGTLAALVYANSFQAGFTLDNAFRILGDARVHQASADNVRQIFTQDYSAPRFVNGVYRPLTTLSLMFNYAVLGGGENPAGYHVLNLLLHWVNAVLVYCLRSEEHTSELQSLAYLVCRLLLEKKKKKQKSTQVRSIVNIADM